MFLSTLKKIVPLKIIKDGSFDNLGFISDPHAKMLTFFESSRHKDLIRSSKGITCIITKKELAKSLKNVKGIVVCEDPRLAFYKIHNYLAKEHFYWKDFFSQIDKSAKIHPKALVAKKNVRIGANTVIEANVVVPERCLIGKNVHIMSGVVLGSIGLQVSRFKEGVVDMAHAGGIKIDDNVQVMPGAVIASAVFRQLTNIGRSSRIGNLAFISHNVQMGERCFVGHGSIINGNVIIGKDVWIGPGSVISNNLEIGDKARVCLGSTVINNVLTEQSVIGPVAIEKRRMLDHIKSLRSKDA